jgi:hypothetical protein
MSSSPALRAPEEQTYPIKRILDDRIFYGVRHYLVQWEGFDAPENTWEPEENFTTAIEIQVIHGRTAPKLILHRRLHRSTFSVRSRLAITRAL